MRTSTIRRTIPLFLLGLLAGCPKPTVDSGDSGSGDTDTGSIVDGQTTAVVVTSDYAVYALATADLDDGSFHDELTALTGSSSVRSLDDGRIYVINSFGYDTIQTYLPGEWSVPQAEWSVGDGTANPHDVEICGDEVFVSLYGRDYIAVYDAESGTLTGTVDMTAFDDGDGIPEVDALVKLSGREGYLYAAAQQLDEEDGWGSNGGAVAEIDCATRTVTNAWDVGSNPKIYAHPTEDASLVVVTGVFYTPDGGISVLDTAKGTHSVVHISEEETGVDINTLAFSASGDALAIGSSIEDYGATYSVSCFDLETWTWSEQSTTSSFLIDAVANDRGEAWILARTSWADAESVGGIWIYDVETCTERTADDRLTFSLDPYSVAFF